MKVLVISDPKEVDTILNIEGVDLLICLGDIYYGDVIKLDKNYNCTKIGVFGNHDPFSLYEGTKFLDLHKNTFDFMGLKIAGFGGCPVYNSKNTPQFTEEEASDFMDSLDKVDVFIAHSNPVYKERTDNDYSHRGFECFNRYIVNKKPTILFHGHLHENNSTIIDETCCICVYHYELFEF